MAYQKVSGGAKDLKKEKVGTVVEGVYLGNKRIQTDLGQQVIWQFRDVDGKPFGIFGFASLNFKMENVPLQAQTKITYKGQSKEKNKFGKFPHLAEVEVDMDSAADGEQVPF